MQKSPHGIVRDWSIADLGDPGTRHHDDIAN
jgi:hypothetical protein